MCITSPDLSELILAAYCYLELEYIGRATEVYVFCKQDTRRVRNSKIDSDIVTLGKWIATIKYEMNKIEDFVNPFISWDNHPLEYPTTKPVCLKVFAEFSLLRKLELNHIDPNPANPQLRFIDGLFSFAAGNFLHRATSAETGGNRRSAAEDFSYCIVLDYKPQVAMKFYRACIKSYQTLFVNA